MIKSSETLRYSIFFINLTDFSEIPAPGGGDEGISRKSPPVPSSPARGAGNSDNWK